MEQVKMYRVMAGMEQKRENAEKLSVRINLCGYHSKVVLLNNGFYTTNILLTRDCEKAHTTKEHIQKTLGINVGIKVVNL